MSTVARPLGRRLIRQIDQNVLGGFRELRIFQTPNEYLVWAPAGRAIYFVGTRARDSNPVLGCVQALRPFWRLRRPGPSLRAGILRTAVVGGWHIRNLKMRSGSEWVFTRRRKLALFFVVYIETA